MVGRGTRETSGISVCSISQLPMAYPSLIALSVQGLSLLLFKDYPYFPHRYQRKGYVGAMVDLMVAELNKFG